MDFKHYQEIDSTNEEAKRIYKDHQLPICISASAQTKGKGRFGKSFHSPTDKGLYFSLVLDLDISIQKLQTLNIEIGELVSKTLNTMYAIQTEAVFPNDVYADDKKLCGILTEAIYDQKNERYECVIVGVGLNVFESEFPEELLGKVTSLQKLTNKALNLDVLKETLCKKILKYLSEAL